MASIAVKDYDGNKVYVLVASGAGTSGNPYISQVVLGAGTAGIGKLTANSGVTIGAVEIATDQTIAVTGTFWQATQPVSLASVPSHDVTNAGTFAVQAAQSGTWTVDLGATDNAVLDAIAASVAGTLTVGTHAVTQSGTWTVDLGATDNAVLDAIAASLAGTLTVGSHAVTNAGVFAVQVDAALPAGTNAIGKLAANSGVDIGDVDVTSVPADPFGVNADGASATGSISAKLRYLAATGLAGMTSLPAGTNAIGKLAANAGVTIGGVEQVASTSGGFTAWKSIDLDESEEEVKGSAGQLYFIHAMNMTASVLYLKVYNNTAAGVTVGTTVPDWTFPIPTVGSTNGAGFTVSFPTGLACGTGITLACTTGLADNDTGAPAANACVVNVGYK